MTEIAATADTVSTDEGTDDLTPDTLEIEDVTGGEDEVLGEGGVKALRAERKRVRELTAEVKRLKTGAPKAEEAGDDIETVKKQIRDEVSREYGMEIIQTEAEAELTSAGARVSVGRLVKLLSLDDVDFSDKVARKEAVRDAVAELKEESPELFRKSRTSREETDEKDPEARRQNVSTDLGKKKPVAKVQSSSEAMAAKRFG